MEDHRRFLHQESTRFGLPKRHSPKDWYFLSQNIQQRHQYHSGYVLHRHIDGIQQVGGLHHLLEVHGQTQLYQIQLKLLQEVFLAHQRILIQ